MEFTVAAMTVGLILLGLAINRRLPGGEVREILSRISSYLGLGPLLLFVALLNMQLWGMSPWTMCLVLLAAAAAVLAPAVAADLAAAGLIVAGFYGVMLGVFWPSIIMPQRAWHNPIYGTVMVGSWWTAALAALEGLALAGAGLWLVPRTLGRHRLVVALAGQVPGLAQICASPAGAGASSGRRPRRMRSMLVKAPRGRLYELRWGVLLVLVGLAGLPLYRQAAPAWAMPARVIMIAAAVVALLVPAVAARVLPFALGLLGLFGIEIALSWFGSSLDGQFANRMYGTAYLDSRWQATLAGLEGVAFLGLALWLVPRTLGGRGQLAALAGRIQRLAQTRQDAVDVAAAELRRVERDLHDGAQARLVAVGMSLRAAERLIPSNPLAALALVAEARDASSRALTELRDLVRGIYPPVLADRGLGDAVRALALDTPIRTEVEVELPGRPARPVESAIYFAVAEVLANAVKHAGARLVQIRMTHADGMLRAAVTDDGAGGADPGAGTGLLGIERRLGTFDGILAVNSPPGGPTIVVIEVPCELSSPRTYSS
jgi:signal transduction histidine kinase